jgi:hypothetical protein
MNSQFFNQTAMNNNFSGNYRLPLIDTQRVMQDNSKTSSASGACFNLDTIVEIGSPIYLFDQENRSNTSKLNKASKKISKASPTSEESPKKVSSRRHNKARNPWTPKEDQKLIELMKKYGQSWAMISSLMDGRTGKQVRDRFLNKLRPNIRCGDWSQREDEILVSLCKELGNRWSLIATHLPGRTEAQVKNRFYSSIKKRMQNDGTFNPIFDSKTSSESTTSFVSTPQEDNGFEFNCELDFSNVNNCGVNFVNNANVMSKVPMVAEEEDYSERTATQLPSPQTSSEYNYDLTTTVAYNEDETLFFTQMQRCGSFLLPVIENDSHVDDAINQVASYFVESQTHGVHSDIDGFFAGNNFECNDGKLEQLNKRKAYLEMALANTLQEMNYL